MEKLTKEEFYKKHCCMCGSQRCEGMDSDWFDGCQHRYELENYTDTNDIYNDFCI